METLGKWVVDVSKAWGGQCDFSISEWLSSPGGGTLILRYSNEFKELSKAICSTACAIAIDKILSLPEGDNRIWVIMDELANFPLISNLEQGLTLARDRGCRFVLSTQDLSQLIKKYGEQEAETLINQCSNQVWLKLNAAKAAKFASDAFGKTEEEIQRTNVQGRNRDDAIHYEKRSHSFDLRREALVHEG